MRKLRLAGRNLLDIHGTPDEGRACMDCEDHPAKIKIVRRHNRDGSAYSITSSTLLHLCQTCALRLVGDLAGMLEHQTRNQVDEELSHTTAQHATIARDTGRAERHDRRVRARLQRLA